MSEHTTEDTINRLKSLTEKLCLVQDRITIDHAVIEIETAIAERDEARRAVCCSALPSDYKEWKPEIVDAMVRMIAAQEGWDCFKENTND